MLPFVGSVAQVRCRILKTAGDLLRVRPETAMTSSVWVPRTAVTSLKGESKRYWVSCLLGAVSEDWAFVILPDGRHKHVAVPVSELRDFDPQLVIALASG